MSGDQDRGDDRVHPSLNRAAPVPTEPSFDTLPPSLGGPAGASAPAAAGPLPALPVPSLPAPAPAPAPLEGVVSRAPRPQHVGRGIRCRQRPSAWSYARAVRMFVHAAGPSAWDGDLFTICRTRRAW